MIWSLTAASKEKSHMDICSADATPGMQGGEEGVEWEEEKGGEVGSGEGYPLILSSFLGVSLF